MQTIARGVLEVIVDQSPFGPEETLEERKTEVGESEFSEEEMPENEAAWRRPASKKKPGETIPLNSLSVYIKFSSTEHFLMHSLESH